MRIGKEKTLIGITAALVFIVGSIITYNLLPDEPIIPDENVFIPKSDYRNAFIANWVGTACENIDYAKSMGYDYVGYQSGMESCSNAKDLKFYIIDPDGTYTLPVANIDFSKTYSASEITQYNDYFLWKNNNAFPNNIATGWYFTTSTFRPLPDYQRQSIIDDMVSRAIIKISTRENRANNFTFGGWAWDVPSLEGDLWSNHQASLGGSQVTISYWTGTCSGAKHPGVTYQYDCYKDARAEYYKKLVTETKKVYPNAKTIMEPFHIYGNWINVIQGRSDCAQLMPDLVLQEGKTTEFYSDSRLLVCGLTKDKIGYTALDVTTNRDATFLSLSSNAAINGMWTGYFGRFGPDTMTSINVVTPREKLLKVFSNWDNMFNIPFSERTWDSANSVYSSRNSYASSEVIYSRHPKTGNIYFIVNSGTARVWLNDNETVVNIYNTDSLFRKTSIATQDFNVVGKVITAKSTTVLNKGYIVELRFT